VVPEPSNPVPVDRLPSVPSPVPVCELAVSRMSPPCHPTRPAERVVDVVGVSRRLVDIFDWIVLEKNLSVGWINLSLDRARVLVSLLVLYAR